MSQDNREIYKEVDALLEEGYVFWDELGFEALSERDKHQITDEVASVVKGKHLINFAAVCQCFYIFQRLHHMVEEEKENATLLGDYFFSRFSHHLIPIDSTKLIDRFSEFLSVQILEGVSGNNILDKEHYKNFIKNISVLIPQ
jgi:hypothetical protein